MSEDIITKKSKQFYENYQFPGNRPVDKDGLILIRRFSHSLNKTKSIGKIRVLDAGCGTGNTSVSLAKQFSDVEFYGVDNCKASLSKANSLAKANKITNVQYRRWNLVNPLPFTFQFDIIVCLGVLHHTSNMQTVLQNLADSLSDKGELYLWIYAQTGRYKHSLNMKLLKILNNFKPKTMDSIEFANEFILNTCGGKFLKDLTGTSNTYLLQTEAAADPVWIADQFLNPHEELISMDQLLKMVNNCGLKVKSLLGINEDVSDFIGSPLVSNIFRKLKGNKRLIALDLLYKPERYFVILKKQRH